MRNAAAALVAIVCWAGLLIQFWTIYGNEHHLLASLWVLARFFTILTNLIVAVVMTLAATGRRPSAELLGGVTLSTILVGLVYLWLLPGLHHRTGPAHIADILLHKVSPLLMSIWWLLFAPRARLKWSAPAKWLIYPLVYLAYVLARAQFDGRYPYPFLDVGRIGWLQAGLNAGGIAFAFILAGMALVWFDAWRPLGSTRANG